VALAAAAAGDALNPPDRQWSARTAVAAVEAYRATLSPVLAKTGLVSCRFEPTCSAYAREALRRHGLVPGGALAAWRIARCNPWAEGGIDRVP